MSLNMSKFAEQVFMGAHKMQCEILEAPAAPKPEKDLFADDPEDGVIIVLAVGPVESGEVDTLEDVRDEAIAYLSSDDLKRELGLGNVRW